MCDYSLHNVASVPAKVGDRLVTTNFGLSSTRGFAAEGRHDTVVCIPPGSELAFEKDVEVDRALGLLPTRKIRARVARFREVNKERPHAHHDALEFPDGTVILLTTLAVGQKASVLQLPAQSKPEGAEAPAETPTLTKPIETEASEPRTATQPSVHRETI